MDFGVINLDGLMSSETKPVITGTVSGCSLLSSSDPETKQVQYGSGYLKQERSTTNEEVMRSSKQQKNSNSLYNHTFLQEIQSLPNESQILSFCCSKNETPSAYKNNQSLTLFPIFHPPYRDRNADFFLANSQMGTLQTGVFTPLQKIELEHQALMFKYITANVPIPSNLLLPLRRARESSRLAFYPGSFLMPNSFGLAPFHLDYSGNADPEPGRCRRTDGKKWRCSRDAVTDQKYCERHVNRGRHRSRKPVEGQSPHSVTTSAKLSTLPSATVAPVTKGRISKSLQINFSPAISSSSQSSSCLSSLPWNQLDYHSQNPNLSVSIPVAAADYMSSTSSPANQERFHELDSIQMGVGGPRGEMLNCGSSNHLQALSLMTQGWDISSRQDCSPTGVVSKTNFSSVSNSSAGSSPITDVK